MQMNAASIKNQKAEWEALGVKLPAFDHEAVTAATKAHPIWVHFGAGNIFRGFVAALQQRLLNEGLSDKGIIAADTFDYDIIDKIYTPYDCLTMNVTLNPDGTTSREIIVPLPRPARQLRRRRDDGPLQGDLHRSRSADDLLHHHREGLCPVPSGRQPDARCPGRHGRRPRLRPPCHEHGRRPAVRALQANAAPLAVVSMDNCSHNGEKLQSSVMTVAKAWAEKGFVGQDFIDYLTDETKITFPGP